MRAGRESQGRRREREPHQVWRRAPASDAGTHREAIPRKVRFDLHHGGSQAHGSLDSARVGSDEQQRSWFSLHNVGQRGDADTRGVGPMVAFPILHGRGTWRGGRMRRRTRIAVIVVATVGLLLAGVAIHGEQHGRETRFIWCAVLSCEYAAVLTWMVHASGLIHLLIRSRRCSCERRYSTTAAYLDGHARGCPLAEAGSDQRSTSPTRNTLAGHHASTEFEWEDLAGSRGDVCSEWGLA